MELLSLIKTIMNQMTRIEDKHDLLFSEIDSDLENRIFEAIDSKNKAKLNSIIKELDNLNENF